MKKLHFLEVEGNTKGFYTFLGLFGLISLLGVLAAYYMEHNGHWVTGMSNQVIWGTPHVFAIFLIVAASGALNVASISSVFAKTAYKPLARLSGMLAMALLALVHQPGLRRRYRVCRSLAGIILDAFPALRQFAPGRGSIRHL